MPDDGRNDERIERLEQEIKRLKKEIEDQSDEKAIRERSDIYRLSRVDNKIQSQEIHGNLRGLNSDDHPHYLNDTRHDVSIRHGDTVLGTRTIDDTETPTGNAGGLKDLFSWLGYMVKKITGEETWKDAPETDLKDVGEHILAAENHIDSTANPHDVTASQVGAIPKSSGDTLPLADESYRGQLFLLEGGEEVSDEIYVCLKEDQDEYSWVRIIGGA